MDRRIITGYGQKNHNKNNDGICPICDFPNLGIYYYEHYGFLKLKTKRVTEYECFKCKCTWKVEDEV